MELKTVHALNKITIFYHIILTLPLSERSLRYIRPHNSYINIYSILNVHNIMLQFVVLFEGVKSYLINNRNRLNVCFL